jgi:hypothetical protein
MCMIDFDSYVEDEEEKRDRGETGDAPSALVSLVVRSCVPRPPESLDDVEWLASLQGKNTRLNVIYIF